VKRRDFLQATAAGVVLGGGLVACGPAESPPSAPAASAAADNRLLDESMRAVLNALGDALVPGAAAAGLADYLEQQLGATPEHALLMLRYLGVPPPYADFYLPALAAVQRWSHSHYGKPVESLDAVGRSQLVADLAAGTPGDWGAAPAAFFYFVLRADAVDVVYGTRDGFERLGIPYMAHIEPQRDW
jgi:hypothetical protein